MQLRPSLRWSGRSTFPSLEVLSAILEQFHPLERLCHDTAIVSVQHLLESTGSLFESLLRMGFRPDNIFLTGKLYSTHKETERKLREALGLNVFPSSSPSRPGFYSQALDSDVKAMWSSARGRLHSLRRIIVLDDGGYSLKNVPQDFFDKTTGIEQTTSGIRYAFGKFPVINVARSATKTLIEPRLVSESVRLRLGNDIKRLGVARIGIVGHGSIGKALAYDLSREYDVCVYDKKTSRLPSVRGPARAVRSLRQLYRESELIIGATGSDISRGWWISECNSDKVLMSVSSGDIEFNNLLRSHHHLIVNKATSPLQTIVLKTPVGHSIRILRGGMVANFTGEANSSPPEVIQVTRGLLLVAVVQAVVAEPVLKGATGPIMLDPNLQKFVVERWFEVLPQRRLEYPGRVVEGFKDHKWIASHSNGQRVDFSTLGFSPLKGPKVDKRR